MLNISIRKWWVALCILPIISWSSCRTEKQLQGAWVGAYRVYQNGGELEYVPFSMVVEFKEDSLNSIDFSHQGGTNFVAKNKAEYKLVDDLLLSSEHEGRWDTLHVKAITSDSLILGLPLGWDAVFKKLPETASPKNVKLTGNAYHISSYNYSDSLDFVNDSIMLHIGSDANVFRTSLWSVVDFGDYKFWVNSELRSPPLLITSYSDATIDLQVYHKDVVNFKMEKLDKQLDLSLLQGKWVEAADTSALKLLLPPPPNLPEDADRRLHMEFDGDSLIRQKFGKSHTTKWTPNNTNRFIYFKAKSPYDLVCWRILHLDTNKLIIKKQEGFDDGTPVFIRED